MSEAMAGGWHPGRLMARPRLVGPLFGALIAAALVVTALAILAALPPPVAPVPPTPPRPVWIDIQRPVQIFSLESAALAGVPLTYTARRMSIGADREDVLSFAISADTLPSLRLKLLRNGPPAAAAAPLFATIVREAADIGLSVTRSGLPDLMATRFGRFEIADVTLAGRAQASDTTCSGFRLLLDAPALAIKGLACGTPAHPMARADLACLLDRLDLSSGGEDHDLITFFAATELTRNPTCTGMRLGPDQLHAAWLDDKPATSRKSLRRH